MELVSALEEAKARGFLGPGPVTAHIEHALPLVERLPASGTAVDLGSGGGVPALVLACGVPGLTWVLVEVQQRRALWLSEALEALGLTDRVEVRVERAEAVGRSALRGAAGVVTARSFGPPAVTAECGAPLLAPGGRLWVAEPPRLDPERWPANGLATLGLSLGDRVAGWISLVRHGEVDERYPRRVGVPEKRPLFGGKRPAP